MTDHQIAAAHEGGPIEMGVLTLSDIAAGDYDPFPLTDSNMEKICEKHGCWYMCYLADNGFHKQYHRYKRGTLQNLLEWLGY
jgi:hypothetical protein